MTTTPIGASSYFGDKPVEKKKDLSMENFMKLLTIQLANQNPLEPMNDRDFFAQMAQLGQVQGMDELNKSLEVTKAQSLMGQTVTAARPFSQGFNEPTVTGVVRQLTYKNGEYKIGIQEANGGMVEVSMGAIQSVEPTSNLTNLQNMIGKKVSGIVEVLENGQKEPKFVEGNVLRVFTENGQNYLRVQVENKQFDMRVDDIRSIAPGGNA